MEHYEIAAYGTLRTFAEILGEDEHVPLLEQTLNEEKEADQKLTRIAEEVNASAEEGETTTSAREETSRMRTRRAA